MAICQGDNAVANEVISQTFEAAERDTSEEVSVKKVNNKIFETCSSISSCGDFFKMTSNITTLPTIATNL